MNYFLILTDSCSSNTSKMSFHYLSMCTHIYMYFYVCMHIHICTYVKVHIYV